MTRTTSQSSRTGTSSRDSGDTRARRSPVAVGALTAATALALGAAAPLSTAAAAPATPATSMASMTSATPAVAVTHYSYGGNAYGSSANVGSVVTSGDSAYVTLGCTTDGALRRSNSTTGVNLGQLARTGVIATTADTSASPVRSHTTASTAGVNLLNGLVRATAVKAASATTRTSTGYSLSSSGTTLTGLVVAGRSVSASAAPNTRITLAGFGYLVVNEQVRSSNSLTVNALHLVITSSNALGIKVGTNVVVSHALSTLSGPVSAVLGGYSYGSKVDVGTLGISGPSFEAFLPCLGTGGLVRSNTGAALNVGTALQAGTVRNTVQGSITATTATGQTTSTVEAAKVLGNLVSATVVKADAHASVSNGTYAFSDSGSSFGTLSVLGHPEITASVKANTQVALPGVGTLYLHRVLRSTHTETVHMIELVLSNPVSGLQAGTVIKVAVASASAS